MKKLRVPILLFLMTINTVVAYAGDSTSFDGFMRSRGLSYVVVAVMLIILLGLFLYLIRLDRKIRKLEK